jgi:hypothetical protein
VITLEDYWMGRDVKYASALTPEIRANAEELIGRVNNLLNAAELDGVGPDIDQVTGTQVASGWRPPAVNDRTRNSASGSKHLTGRAVDLQDTRGRDLARWCLRQAEPGGVLEQFGLWMERPQWTGGADPWVHLQCVPPGSGKRVYVPSTMPARIAALPEEEAFA